MYWDKCDYEVQNKNLMLNEVSESVDRNDERDHLTCQKHLLDL